MNIRWRFLASLLLLVIIFSFAGTQGVFAAPDMQHSKALNLTQQDYSIQDTKSKETTVSQGWALLQLLFFFGIVIGLIYFAAKYFNKRVGTWMRGGFISVIDSSSLGMNKTIHIVEVAGKLLVLGVTDKQINLLMEIKDEEVSTLLSNRKEVDQQKPNFAGILNQFVSKITAADKTPQANLQRGASTLQKQLERLRELENKKDDTYEG